MKKKKKKSTLQIIRPPRCRMLHLRFDPYGTEKSLDLVPDIPQFE
jgi:hypothetical protein